MTNLDILIDYTKDGWSIFPCKKDKSPYTAHGYQDSSNDYDQIKVWNEGLNPPSWGLDLGKANLAVIDIDVRNGGYLKEENDHYLIGSIETGKKYSVPKTRLVQTGGGGFHLYYSGARKLPKELDKGIDLKSIGGYVIIPPSMHESGNNYEWQNDLVIAPFPLDLLAKEEQKSKFSLPETILEGERNDTLFKLGCSLRNKGFGENEILSTLETANSRCSAPLNKNELETIVSSVMKYEPKIFPNDQRETKVDYQSFDKKPDEPKKTTWSVTELLDIEIPEIKWAIPNVIPEGLTILGGRPKVGKSWLSLQMAHSVGTGGIFFGSKVEKAKCLYIALEDNPRRLQQRIKAQGFPRNAEVDFVTEWRPLQNKGFEDLVNAIHEQKYKLIIIDTLTRAFPGIDQNDQVQISRVMDLMQRLCGDTSTSIVFVDHISKPKGFSSNGDPVDDIMNSTVKVAVADLIIALYKEQGKGARLKGRGREVEEFDYSLSWDREYSFWRKDGDSNELRLGKEKQEVLDVLDVLGQSRLPNISNTVGKDRSNVYHTLNDLCNDGFVRKINIGREVYFEKIEVKTTRTTLDNKDNEDNKDNNPSWIDD